MQIPSDLKYTKSHEWARLEAGEVKVGITAHAQEELRDVVFVELPEIGKVVKAGDAVAVVESVKAAFDIYAPVAGTVCKVNDALSSNPALINDNCYGAGWIYALKADAPGEWEALMGAKEYETLIQSEV